MDDLSQRIYAESQFRAEGELGGRSFIDVGDDPAVLEPPPPAKRAKFEAHEVQEMLNDQFAMFNKLMNAVTLLTTAMQASIPKNAPTQIEHSGITPKKPNESEQPQQLRSELGVSTSTADGVPAPQIGLKKYRSPSTRNCRRQHSLSREPCGSSSAMKGQ